MKRPTTSPPPRPPQRLIDHWRAALVQGRGQLEPREAEMALAEIDALEAALREIRATRGTIDLAHSISDQALYRR